MEKVHININYIDNVHSATFTSVMQMLQKWQ